MSRVVEDHRHGFRLQILCENQWGHLKVENIHCRNKTDATRTINQFVAPKGYRVYRYILEDEWILL